jgi:hypothetical protein
MISIYGFDTTFHEVKSPELAGDLTNWTQCKLWKVLRKRINDPASYFLATKKPFNFSNC